MSIVYILTNEAMPGLIKIGMTTTTVRDRMVGLDTTGVPLPFECYYAARVSEMAKVEKALHVAFGDHRVRGSREFFRIDPYRARAVLELLAVEDVTPREEAVIEPGDQEAIDLARRMRPRFEFTMANVPMGAELSFGRGEEYFATVINDRLISFRGDETSLSASAAVILGELGYANTSVQGTAYWLYQGRTLDELRRENEGVGPYGLKS